MTRPEVAALRRLVSRADNPLVRAVGRAPVKVRTKLLVAFLAIAGLLVVVALLGLRVLGQSNSRSESLKALQVRSAAYQNLSTEASTFRDLLGLCAGGAGVTYWLGGGNPHAAKSDSQNKCLHSIDRVVGTALADLGQSLSPAQLAFKPAPNEQAVLGRVQKDFRRLGAVVAKLRPTTTPSIQLHQRAENLADDLKNAAASLAALTTAKTDELVAQNRHSYSSSRDLFIGVAAGAVALALLLGLVFSWSLIGPIQRIGARLASIARGDFAGQVEVVNRDELGELGRNVNRMNDELQRLYRELELASEHKSEFLANMSHELRTPLNAILGFSQVLQQGLFGELNDKQAEYVADVLSSAEHLLSLINDILDLSKVEAGQVELEVAPFSLREALDRGVVMLRERAGKHGVQLSLEHGPDVDVVEADERRIRQVLFNLLSNAVKFTPEGGSVDVRSARLNGEVRVSVADTGPGIAPEDQGRIFEEFQQTDIGTKQSEGTGLGLALSKRLVELHGGRLWVESDIGKGAKFTFALPSSAP